jgi:hypothetical protein
MQARLFNNPASGVNVLIASDAIGLGLNFNIRYVWELRCQLVVLLAHVSCTIRYSTRLWLCGAAVLRPRHTCCLSGPGCLHHAHDEAWRPAVSAQAAASCCMRPPRRMWPLSVSLSTAAAAAAAAYQACDLHFPDQAQPGRHRHVQGASVTHKADCWKGRQTQQVGLFTTKAARAPPVFSCACKYSVGSSGCDTQQQALPDSVASTPSCIQRTLTMPACLGDKLLFRSVRVCLCLLQYIPCMSAL